MRPEPENRDETAALVQVMLNAAGEIAPSQPPRTFFIREGDEADADVVREVFVDRSYDIERVPGGETSAARMAERYAQICSAGKCPVIVDAGAMIGASAVYYQMLFPQSLVVAVEPERTNFALLEMNCRGLHVRAIEGAVSSQDKSLFLSDPGYGHFGFRTAESGVYEVSASRIDRILSELGTGTYEPFLCKINIEGGEAELFDDNLDWLGSFAAVTIELHDWMLPGKAVSRNFFKAIGARDFDVVFRDLSAFCFNNALLQGAEPRPVRLEDLIRRPEVAMGHIDVAEASGYGDGRRETAPPLVLPRGSRLTINGWAADPAARRAGTGLIATIGDVELDLSSAYGAFRGDVPAAFGASDALAPCGFDAVIEAADLPDGRHQLRLGVIGTNGIDVFTLPQAVEINVVN